MEAVAQALGTVSVDRIREDVLALQGIRHPVTAPDALLRAEEHVRGSLARAGYDLGEHRFTDSGREYKNVIATRPGNRYPERRVLLLAHFDTVASSPGADDNASGVAVLLEAARILAPLRFEKTLQLVGVNLEECAEEGEIRSATRGSRALAATAREERWEIEAVLVLESVGFAGDDVVQVAPAGVPFPVPERGDFLAVVGNENSGGLVQGFAGGIAQYRIPLPILPLVVPGNGEILPDSRRSDHAPFWDLGFKSVMLTDTSNFRSPHYHSPSDTIGTLNLAFAAEVCRASAALLAELASPLQP
jgi:Zn-dependent M28 family amino/carboxypeptidase